MGTTDAELAPRSADITSAFVPFLAVAVVVVAAVSEPAGWPYAIPLIVPVVLFFVWSRRDIPALPLTLLVVAAVSLSQLSGELEPALFLLSLLALVITGWTELGAGSLISVVLVLAAPPALAFLWPDGDIAWGTWMVGIAFPAFRGWAFHRQEALSADLEQARRDLAEQAVSEERRRIARDVHDLVGHGLAAMMLQVTSARHVLHRDADAADEALEAAEEVGRQSMGELRHTVSLLREGDSATAAPPPGISQLGALVDSARAGGLRVDHQAYGDHERVDTVRGLAIYRIAQESLANASRHAPAAQTVLTTTVTDVKVELSVVTTGPLSSQQAEADRPRYGLRGMRERIDAVGGDFSAGPTADGWAVHCTVPLAADETADLGSAVVGR